MPGRTAIPQTAADITPQWLTAALRERGHLDERNEVASIATTDVGAGRGFVGQTLRLDLTYEREGASGPASLIAKMPLGYEIPAEQHAQLHLAGGAQLLR